MFYCMFYFTCDRSFTLLLQTTVAIQQTPQPPTSAAAPIFFTLAEY